MEFRKVVALNGPNIWARCPVLEVVIDLASLKSRPLDAFPGFAERLRHRLPSLGGVEEPDPARALGLTTLELQCLAGSPVAFMAERPAGEPGVVRVAIEFEEVVIARAALELARGFCLAALDDEPFDLADNLARLGEIADEARLGPSTRSIVEAARERGIPTRRLDAPGSLVLLGQGSKQRRIRTAETDATGTLAESIAQDKDLTKVLLQSVGVPIPEGRPVQDADDAWLAAEEVGLPVVVKPLDGNHGRGVATDLTTRDQVVAAYAAARLEGSKVLVERFIKGEDYRLLVVGGRLVASARRDPAHVLGDGFSTVLELVETVNSDPRRGEGHASSLTRLRLDDPIAQVVLAEQGFAAGSVPPTGVRVLIRRNANLSTGGTAEDVTDLVHPDVAARAVDAARVIGLDIAGIDLVAEGVDRPLERSGGAVVEVNAGPGLRMHLEPSAGTPRPVGREIVAMLFPESATGRIPVVAVLENGEARVSLRVAQILADSGKRVGLACSDGIFLGSRRLRGCDQSGAEGTRLVLINPAVDIAVLGLSANHVIEEGLGFDVCDMVVLGKPDAIESEAGRVLAEALAPEGWIVRDRAAGRGEPFPTRTVFIAAEANEGVWILQAGNSELIRLPADKADQVPMRIEAGLAAAVGWRFGIGP